MEHCRAPLGVEPGVTLEELRRAFVNKNFALIRNGTAEEKQRLREAHEALVAHLHEQEKATRAPFVPIPLDAPIAPELRAPVETTPVAETPAAGPEIIVTHDFFLVAFDNWRVNVIVPPLLVALMWLVNKSPLAFFLQGFHVWMHEFGHATAAWMTGRKALPLPFGLTPIEPDFSKFVYIGLLALFVVLFVAGWRERKVWPMLAAVVLLGVQAYMTWGMPVERQMFWWTFGGVGGEFYLSALFMAFFFVQLPDKFRWGACRYIFFLIGATCFLQVYLHWEQIYRGLADIPMGSMINGEDDRSGDMNILMDDYGWTNSHIRRTYHLLGNGCLIGLGAIYAAFALRLNRVADWVVGKFSRTPPAAD